MADFCKQCSIELFGSDMQDLAGLVPEGFFTCVMCEGCGGNCVVARDGTCVSESCLKEHGGLQRGGDESARVEQWAANYLDCQTESNNDTQCSK